MRQSAAISLLICLISADSAQADLSDVIKYFPDDSLIVVTVDLEQTLGAAPTKRLLGGKTLGDFLAETKLIRDLGGNPFPPIHSQLLGGAKRVTIVPQIFGESTVLFEGTYDSDQLLRDTKSLGRLHKEKVTTETVGDHEIVRIGNSAYCVVDKTLVVSSSSPPRGSPAGGFLSAKAGGAEEILTEVIARAEKRSKPNLNAGMAAALAGPPKRGPISVCVSPGKDEFTFVAQVQFNGDDFRITGVVNAPNLNKAKELELEILTSMRKQANELENVPVAKCLKAATVDRSGKRVTIELVVPADVLKDSLKSLLGDSKK